MAFFKWIENTKLKWIEETNTLLSGGRRMFSDLNAESRKFSEFCVISMLGLFEDDYYNDLEKFSSSTDKKSSIATFLMYSIAECFDENPYLWPSL